MSGQSKTDYYYPDGDLARSYQPNSNQPMMTDEMYATELVSLPWLEPGQEVTIPVVLTPATFRYYSGGVRSKCPSVDDWPYLFYGGVTRVTAAPVCASDFDKMIPTVMACGTADHKEYDNPAAPETYVAPLQAVPAN